VFGPPVLFLLGALVSPASLASLCVMVHSHNLVHTVPVTAGDPLQIAFTHSIYDSRVEERFIVGASGFIAIDVRYSERRLADFYGHESARREGDWWIVRRSSQLPTLTVRASNDALVRLTIGNRKIALTDGVARLAPSACSRATSHD
jgi:Domain of unknown function (DUF1850)